MNTKLLFVALVVLSLSACRGRGSQREEFVEEKVEYVRVEERID